MKVKYILAFVLSGILMSACTSSKTNNEPENCSYNYSDKQTTLEWTAYKFTNNTPVKGTFNNITISAINDATSLEELVGSIGFTIPVASLETQDELKNNNIIQGFFETVKTDVLKGNVIDVKDHTLVFEVELNGVKEKVSGVFELNGEFFTFMGTMHLNAFNAANGIKALNDKCGDNHKGEDGVVTVSEKVDIHFTTRITKSCK